MTSGKHVASDFCINTKKGINKPTERLITLVNLFQQAKLTIAENGWYLDSSLKCIAVFFLRRKGVTTNYDILSNHHLPHSLL